MPFRIDDYSETTSSLYLRQTWKSLNLGNIYISAIFWGGKPREVIELGRSGHIWIFSSSEIEKEIDEKLRLKFKLDADEAIYVLLDFATFTTPVKITNRIKAVPDDPDDANS